MYSIIKKEEIQKAAQELFQSEEIIHKRNAHFNMYGQSYTDQEYSKYKEDTDIQESHQKELKLKIIELVSQ